MQARRYPMQGKIHFGVYELDRDAMELRKHGVPIRLQDQPLRVLTILSERPGEIVTREELQDQIWGKDTFVDFDQSLNKAVNRIREVLNDNAATPRYIETVPRRGYRFVAPVTGDVSTEPHSADLGLEKPRRHLSRSSKLAVLAIAGLAVVLGIAAVLWWRKPQQPILPKTRRVTSAASWLGGPSLSRDGKLLAYAAAVEGEVPHIRLQQTASGEAIPVTMGAEGEVAPDFSPDGTHIAYWSRGGGVYLAPALGGEPKLVAKTAEGRPHFSPEGESIVFAGGPRGAITVSVGSGEEAVLDLSENFSAYGDILWSPDGGRVLFYGANKHEPSNRRLGGPPLLTREKLCQSCFPACRKVRALGGHLLGFEIRMAANGLSISSQKALCGTCFGCASLPKGKSLGNPSQSPPALAS
jgi:DNA-binding winged helix-turn-helix (wHTH) protein